MDDNADRTGHRERLRSRWKAGGAPSFADYELLEFLLAHVFVRGDTKSLAKRLVEKFGTLKGVLDAPPHRLAEVHGAGEKTALFVSLLRGTMDRYFETQAKENDLINSPESVINCCRASLEGLTHEVFDVLYLSTKNRLIGRERLAEGTIDQATVYPRRLVASALAHNAASLIFVHNHPSGDPAPSPDDRRLTTLLHEATKTVSIRVLDHLIIGNGRHYSFREQGLL